LVVLYVTSSEGAAGKTAICAGIGQHLLSLGKQVGYLKPVVGAKTSEGDCQFMKKVLELEAADSLCPVIADQKNLESDIKKACDKVSAGKDVVIVEGVSGQADSKVAEALSAKVILVGDHSNREGLIGRGKDFGKSLLGVVLNKVPMKRLEQVRNDISAQAGEAGVSILGVLPEDRILYALTISELAEHLQGEILNSPEESAEVVENIMVGAMCVDPGPVYFGRKANKAAVIRSDRPDMQMAALETSTRCLVVTGDTELFPSVLYGAETKKVPIISVKGDISATVAGIEDALGKLRFNQEKKLKRLAEVMGQHFDFQAVYQV